jgi:hypothetical protein
MLPPPGDTIGTIGETIDTILPPLPPIDPMLPPPGDTIGTVTAPIFESPDPSIAPVVAAPRMVATTGASLGSRAAPPPATATTPILTTSPTARSIPAVRSTLRAQSQQAAHQTLPTAFAGALFAGGGNAASGSTGSSPSQSPAPTPPGGALSSVPGSAPGGLFLIFAALLVAWSAARPRLMRGLIPVPATWRPVPLLSLLERPG